MNPCPHCGARCVSSYDEWENPIDKPWRVVCSHCDYFGTAAPSESEAEREHAINFSNEKLGKWDST